MWVEQSLLRDSSQEWVNSHFSFASSESLVRGNYLKYQRFPEAKELALRQIWENQELQRNFERQVSMETRENLDKEAMVQQAKKMLYEKLWINENISQNNGILNFAKWVIDTLLFDNIELALQIWETGWKILIDALKQLISWEGVKKVAQSLWENIQNIFTGNAYEKWKSAAELWLISTGLTAGIALWKKWIKLWMKELSRLWLNKERIVQSAEVKWVIHQTKSRIDSIIPKKQVDFEKAFLEDVAKLGNAERKEAAKFYLKRELSPQQQEAIIKAHEVWSTRAWAWIHTYTQKELLEKVRILEQTWFTKEERRVLLEKGVCGKMPVWHTLEDIEFMAKRPPLEAFDKLDVTKKLELLWIPKEFYDLLNSSWFMKPWFDIIERYKKFYYWDIPQKNWKTFLKSGLPINYQKMIDEAIVKHPWLTKTEAMMVFASTDNYIISQLNWALRSWKILSESQKKVIETLDQALTKMPTLEWRHIIRWDGHHSWVSSKEISIDWKIATNVEIAQLIKEWKIAWLQKWESIPLKWYTYVGWSTGDIFLWGPFPKNDTLVMIRWERLWIRDISSLSLFKQFWDRLWVRTEIEWMIERWSSVEFINSRVFPNAPLENGSMTKDIVVVRVKK